MKKISLLLFCTGILFASKGQLNKLDSTAFTARLACSGSLLEGNVSRLLLVNRLDLNYAGQQWGYSNRTDYQYGEKNRSLSENDLVAYNFFYYQPAKKIYPFIMTIVETNYRRKILFRYQAGPGITYTLVKKPISLLRASFSATYEHTRFKEHQFENLADTSSNTIATYRITPRIYGVHALWKGKLNIVYELWLQQSIEHAANYRFFLEQGWEVPLIKHLDLKTTIRYTYENVRLKGLKAYDLFWVFGIIIKNY